MKILIAYLEANQVSANGMCGATEHFKMTEVEGDTSALEQITDSSIATVPVIDTTKTLSRSKPVLWNPGTSLEQILQHEIERRNRENEKFVIDGEDGLRMFTIRIRTISGVYYMPVGVSEGSPLFEALESLIDEEGVCDITQGSNINKPCVRLPVNEQEVSFLVRGAFEQPSQVVNVGDLISQLLEGINGDHA